MKKLIFILLFVVCFIQSRAQAYFPAYQGVYFSGSNAPYIPTDTDALKYVDSVALTDFVSNPIRIAIDTLVIKLKRDTFFTTLFFFHPYPVQSANGNKWNLLNVHNTDAAYRLTFIGSPTFTANGMTLNGTSQYAKTHFIPSTNGFTTSSASFGFYSETQSTSGTQIYGCFDGPSNLCQLNMTTANVAIGNLVAATYTPSTTKGLIMGSRTATTSLAAYIANTSVATSSSSVSAMPTIELYVGARNNSGTAGFFSTHTCAGDFAGPGMNAARQTKIYNIFQDWELRMNRQQ